MPIQYAFNLGQLEPGTMIIPPSAQQNRDAGENQGATTDNVRTQTRNTIQTNGNEAGDVFPATNNQRV